MRIVIKIKRNIVRIPTLIKIPLSFSPNTLLYIYISGFVSFPSIQYINSKFVEVEPGYGITVIINYFYKSSYFKE
jgi:hypothetical protein